MFGGDYKFSNWSLYTIVVSPAGQFTIPINKECLHEIRSGTFHYLRFSCASFQMMSKGGLKTNLIFLLRRFELGKMNRISSPTVVGPCSDFRRVMIRFFQLVC